MKKIKLSLDDLEVKSFDVLPEGAGASGTVEGHAGTGSTTVPCGLSDDCTWQPHTCNPTHCTECQTCCETCYETCTSDCASCFPTPCFRTPCFGEC